MRETAGRAAAAVANWRNWRRASFIMIPSEVWRRERATCRCAGCKADRAEWLARVTFQSFICRRDQRCRDMTTSPAPGVLALSVKEQIAFFSTFSYDRSGT